MKPLPLALSPFRLLTQYRSRSASYTMAVGEAKATRSKIGTRSAIFSVCAPRGLNVTLAIGAGEPRPDAGVSAEGEDPHAGACTAASTGRAEWVSPDPARIERIRSEPIGTD